MRTSELEDLLRDGAASLPAPSSADSRAEVAKRVRRHRLRRRSALAVASVALIVGGVTAGTAISRAPHESVIVATPAVGPSGALPVTDKLGAVITPEAPGALAVGPAGGLYAIDTGRNEILRYTPAGFSPLAGDGRAGLSPDGTPALHARLRLAWYSGLAVSADGIVYFTDDGRIRDIRPDGDIGTVAGGGTVALGRTPVAADRADLSSPGDGLAGLAFGPGGDLFVGTSAGVYRLGADRRLYRVIGGPSSTHGGGAYANPAVPSDFNDAVHLSFDSDGDLFVAGGWAGYGLYERSATGRLRFVEVLLATGGAPGSLAAAPDQTVVAVDGTGIQRLRPRGASAKITPHWPPFRAPDGQNIAPALGQGVAVGPDGQIYVDTNVGDSFPDQGIFEVLRSGRTAALWVRSS